MPPREINGWMAEYMIRAEDMEEDRMAARVQAGLADVKRSLR